MSEENDSNLNSIEVISDLICPWCYIGKRRLERSLALLKPAKFQVVWRPFRLNPQMPAEGMDRRAYRTKKFGWEKSLQLDQQVVQAGLEVGLQFNYDKIQRTPNTMPGHKLLWLANSLGVQDAVAEGLFAAYFTEGRDVGSTEVLVDVGRIAGIAEQRVRKALLSNDVELEVMREEEAGRRVGIQGVPTVIVSGKVLRSGAQHERLLSAEISKAYGLTQGQSCSVEGCE